MNISEILTQIREKAKDLNIELELDDEDIQIFALNHLLSNMEELFESEDESDINST